MDKNCFDSGSASKVPGYRIEEDEDNDLLDEDQGLMAWMTVWVREELVDSWEWPFGLELQDHAMDVIGRRDKRWVVIQAVDVEDCEPMERKRIIPAGDEKPFTVFMFRIPVFSKPNK
jgi:hypothetical protein